jgi:hydroxymethylpyrimidine/phosphomethylpyrimidine kinase
VPPEVILKQVRAVGSDIGVDAVKVGMLGTVPTIAAVAEALDELPPSVPIVLDPVMVAESGAELLQPPARASLVDLLVPRATVITPNLPEAKALVREGGADPETLSIEQLARNLYDLRPRAVVITGGHRDRGVDVFFDGSGLTEIAGAWHAGGAAHGSGCTHSSVLAARLAWGDTPLEAARVAKEMASGAIAAGLAEIGAGPGPVDVLGLVQAPL